MPEKRDYIFCILIIVILIFLGVLVAFSDYSSGYSDYPTYRYSFIDEKIQYEGGEPVLYNLYELGDNQYEVFGDTFGQLSEEDSGNLDIFHNGWETKESGGNDIERTVFDFTDEFANYSMSPYEHNPIVEVISSPTLSEYNISLPGFETIGLDSVGRELYVINGPGMPPHSSDDLISVFDYNGTLLRTHNISSEVHKPFDIKHIRYGAYDLRTVDSVETSIDTQDTSPLGIAWNNEGTRLYEVGESAEKIYQYEVATPFDIDTATYSTSIDTQDGYPTGIAWSSEGTRLYEVGANANKTYQYEVATPFDIDTATYSTSIDTQDSGPTDIAWNNEGTRLYEIGAMEDKIYQYEVATPFDIDTATYSTSIDTKDTSPTGVAWSSEGTKLYEVGKSADKIYQYEVATPFDIDTATYSTSIDAQDGYPAGIAWSSEGTRLYEIGKGAEKIYQYNLSEHRDYYYVCGYESPSGSQATIFEYNSTWSNIANYTLDADNDVCGGLVFDDFNNWWLITDYIDDIIYVYDVAFDKVMEISDFGHYMLNYHLCGNLYLGVKHIGDKISMFEYNYSSTDMEVIAEWDCSGYIPLDICPLGDSFYYICSNEDFITRCFTNNPEIYKTIDLDLYANMSFYSLYDNYEGKSLRRYEFALTNGTQNNVSYYVESGFLRGGAQFCGNESRFFYYDTDGIQVFLDNVPVYDDTVYKHELFISNDKEITWDITNTVNNTLYSNTFTVNNTYANDSIGLIAFYMSGFNSSAYYFDSVGLFSNGHSIESEHHGFLERGTIKPDFDEAFSEYTFTFFNTSGNFSIGGYYNTPSCQDNLVERGIHNWTNYNLTIYDWDEIVIDEFGVYDNNVYYYVNPNATFVDYGFNYSLPVIHLYESYRDEKYIPIIDSTYTDENVFYVENGWLYTNLSANDGSDYIRFTFNITNVPTSNYSIDLNEMYRTNFKYFNNFSLLYTEGYTTSNILEVGNDYNVVYSTGWIHSFIKYTSIDKVIITFGDEGNAETTCNFGISPFIIRYIDFTDFDPTDLHGSGIFDTIILITILVVPALGFYGKLGKMALPPLMILSSIILFAMGNIPTWLFAILTICNLIVIFILGDDEYG